MMKKWRNVYILRTGQEDSYATASAKNRREARTIFQEGLNKYISGQESITENFIPARIQRVGETFSQPKLIRLVLSGKVLLE